MASTHPRCRSPPGTAALGAPQLGEAACVMAGEPRDRALRSSEPDHSPRRSRRCHPAPAEGRPTTARARRLSIGPGDQARWRDPRMDRGADAREVTWPSVSVRRVTAVCRDRRGVARACDDPRVSPETSNRRCTICGSRLRLLPVLYGMPTSDAFEEEQRGELVIGGCEPDGPTRVCAVCHQPPSRPRYRSMHPDWPGDAEAMSRSDPRRARCAAAGGGRHLGSPARRRDRRSLRVLSAGPGPRCETPKRDLQPAPRDVERRRRTDARAPRLAARTSQFDPEDQGPARLGLGGCPRVHT